ncbi:MAG: nuclear transport factor 2 family protein [Acidimicrobiales bacterium]
MTADELGTRLFAAIEAGAIDVLRDEIYAPNAVIWHNLDGAEQGVDDNLRTLGRVARHVTGLRYDDVRREPTPTGFVQQHVLRGTAPGGELAVPACLVVTVDGDRITRIDEYLDSAAVAALRGA